MLQDLLRVYAEGNKYLILNPQVPAWIVTNRAGILTIKEYCGNLSTEETSRKIHFYNPQIPVNSVKHFLQNAKSALLFNEDSVEHFHKPYFLNAVYLNMTQKCNLKCSYCFATEREETGRSFLETNDYKSILNDAIKLCDGTLDIVFTGGEPLLSENTIPVAEYAKELGLTTRILTNATLIDEKNIERLTNLFDLFKISVDGSSEAKHDSYRGKGNYEKTIHAIELLKTRGTNIQIAMTVTKENVSDVSAMNKKWGKLLTYQPLFPLGKAKEDCSNSILSGKEYYDILCCNENINPFSDIRNIIKAHYASRSIMKCSMGDGELSISCTGDVYPCQLLHSKSFYLGNLHENSLTEIYNSEKNSLFKTHTVECIEGCKTCDFRYLCGGACQARHFSQTGNIDKAGTFCEYEKLGIVHSLISTCKMVEF